jgi:hypothetical protein
VLEIDSKIQYSNQQRWALYECTNTFAGEGLVEGMEWMVHYNKSQLNVLTY